jgi:hypothetical protein
MKLCDDQEGGYHADDYKLGRERDGERDGEGATIVGKASRRELPSISYDKVSLWIRSPKQQV